MAATPPITTNSTPCSTRLWRSRSGWNVVREGAGVAEGEHACEGLLMPLNPLVRGKPQVVTQQGEVNACCFSVGEDAGALVGRHGCEMRVV
jgi:hypothetical protein